MTDIEHEPAGAEVGTTAIVARTEAAAPAIFNPLDAEPVSFKQALVSRSENYDALAMHLRGMLVPGKDFGRIHIAKKTKCSEPWNCSYEKARGHWSPYMLFAAGADKVLGMLGLASHYPGEDDFIRAAVTGKQISDVIMKCHLISHHDQVISEGMGACSRDEVSGSLNNAIKRACKRARVDAVLRLPSISALFEDDFLAEVDRNAQKQNSTSSRQRQVRSGNMNAGADLHTFPLGGKLEGQKFADMDEGALNWCVQTFDDKPDIKNSAIKELQKRAQDPKHETATSSTPSHGDSGGYEDYPEAQ